MRRAVHELHLEPARIPADGLSLEGDLELPEGAAAVVLFAHGSGSSRFSPRNRCVARALREAGFGTLLMDLLTPAEEDEERWTGHLRFDIRLLSRRLCAATDWLRFDARTRGLGIGYFGASTGAAAALTAAVDRPSVKAVVSRGGRPDLAGAALSRVRSPTLLIVGSRDAAVIGLNEEALALIPAVKKLEIVPGATHLFEEPGTLERAAELARDWFARFLAPRPSR